MSAPSPDPTCPLTAIAQPLSELVSEQNNTLAPEKFTALLKQALQLYSAAVNEDQFTPGRSYPVEHDAVVHTFKALPRTAASTRLARCAWHARKSVHDPVKDSHKLSYQDFYEGLAVDHPIKERQYIHEIMRYERVGPSVATPSSSWGPVAVSQFVHAVRADVWVTEYKLPIITSNRDFCQLFMTVEFTPHPNPLSKAHIDAVLSAIDDKQSTTDDAPAASTAGRRSCLNIQLPVATSACEPQANFVRAFYGSVEVLRELEGDKTEWWMAVQSDSAGRVPLMFQEMAMPSKVAPDVPSFIGWAVKQKQVGDKQDDTVAVPSE